MVQQLIRKDERTFNGLYDQYAGVLYGIICREVSDRHIADNLLQQTFAQAWRQLAQYDSGQNHILMWLIRQCRNVIQEYTGVLVDLTAPRLLAQSG